MERKNKRKMSSGQSGIFSTGCTRTEETERENSVINFRANVIPAFPVGGFNRAVGGRCGKRKFQMN